VNSGFYEVMFARPATMVRPAVALLILSLISLDSGVLSIAPALALAGAAIALSTALAAAASVLSTFRTMGLGLGIGLMGAITNAAGSATLDRPQSSLWQPGDPSDCDTSNRNLTNLNPLRSPQITGLEALLQPIRSYKSRAIPEYAAKQERVATQTGANRMNISLDQVRSAVVKASPFAQTASVIYNSSSKSVGRDVVIAIGDRTLALSSGTGAFTPMRAFPRPTRSTHA
jgi:hypothetical protein